MSYTQQELAAFPRKKGFRLRGLEMTRLETFLDAAFAFAITMLVISLDKIPENYAELITALKGMPAFGASFAIMMFFWVSHRRWSRYYGLEDGVSIFLSLSLIFVLLVYIYPLKLMFSACFSWMSGGWLPSEFQLSARAELIKLFIIYGVGLFAMAGLMALLYLRAQRVGDQLKLDHIEKLLTRQELMTWLNMAATGLGSALFAMVMPAKVAVFSGFVYMTLNVSAPWLAISYGKKLKHLQQRLSDLEAGNAAPGGSEQTIHE